jgi:hypothetical protein
LASQFQSKRSKWICESAKCSGKTAAVTPLALFRAARTNESGPCNLAHRVYSEGMKTSKLILTIAVASFVSGGIAAADPLAPAVAGKAKAGEKEKLTFVTGSRIPQRVTVKAIGTSTTSPVRVYTRAEIDRTGRFTTEGILAQDPSVTIIGNGSH